MTHHLVGVIGGMGPAATALFSLELARRTAAQHDQDHIATLVLNDTEIPDRTAFLLDPTSPSPVDQLVYDAQFLERAGCTLLAMPCNTAHAFWETVQKAVDVPLVNMVEEAAQRCADTGAHVVGILATEGTIVAHVYDEPLARRGMRGVYPSKRGQELVSSMIYDKVKSGRHVPAKEIEAICAEMFGLGCEAIVLGCTELSVAFGGTQTENTGALHDDADAATHPAYIVDALAVLADAVIKQCGHRVRI